MKRVGVTIVAVLGALIGPVPPTAGGGFDRAVEALWPRVVKLYGMGAGRQAGYGSGVLVSEDGLVLTVFSLLIDARRIKAVTADGTTYEADVVDRDLVRQLVLLRLKPAGTEDESRVPHRFSGGGGQFESPRAEALGHPTIPAPGSFLFFDLSRPTSLFPGDWVLAAGNAFKVAEGAEPVSLAHGVFSIRTRLDARRNLKDYPYRGEVLVIDAITSNPGAPGSAVVDLDGEFVGMVGRVVTSNRTHTNFNYAVPRDVLYDFFVEATSAGVDETGASISRTPERKETVEADMASLIGLRVSQFGYRKVLPFVEHVRIGSPAERAGVRKDDLVLSINGTTVSDAASFESRLRSLGPGEPIDLVLRRGRAFLTVHVEPESQK